jgi:hypothetical protein
VFLPEVVDAQTVELETILEEIALLVNYCQIKHRVGRWLYE